MSYQRSASRVKFVNTAGANETLILPVDDMKVSVEPYVADGGSVQELVDGTLKFLTPTFRYKIELNYAYERTEARPTIYDTVDDLLALFFASSAAQTNGVDVHVKYENGAWDTTNGDYICYGMIPDIKGGTMATEFEKQARVKSRELTLRGISKNNTYSDIRWILE